MSGGGILALDIASNTGFAVTNEAYVASWRPRTLLEGPRTAKPEGLWSGSRRLAIEGSKHAAYFAGMRRWLDDMLKVYAPAEIAIEAPMPNGRNADADRRILGLIAHVEEIAFSRQIELTYHGLSTVKKFAAGFGNAVKGDMVRSAKLMGWNPKSNDEADALWVLEKRLHDRFIFINRNQRLPGGGKLIGVAVPRSGDPFAG